MSEKRTFPAYESSVAWKNFSNTIKSTETKAHYKLNLVRFLHFAKVNNAKALDKFVTADRKYLERVITDFIVKRQDVDGVRPQTVMVEASCIKHLFTYNDRSDINWKIIKGYFHEAIKVVKDRAYVTEEIAKMLTYTDIRSKCIILLMASSGIRVGAIPTIRIKDLLLIENPGIYQMTIYPNTKDEYITYCSPECKSALDAYLDYRKLHGETITENSPLIRDVFDFAKPTKKREAKAIHRDTLMHLTNIITQKAGLRIADGDGARSRKVNMLNHGFRKFFFKACGKAQIDPIVRELLMGHKVGSRDGGVTKLMVTYDATEDNELLHAYRKVIEFVTITDENRAKIALAKQEIVNKAQRVEIDQFKSALAQLQEQGVITLPK